MHPPTWVIERYKKSTVNIPYKETAYVARQNTNTILHK